jgi:hypothetical protein
VSNSGGKPEPFLSINTMKRKDKRLQAVLLGQNDFVHRLWKQIFPNFGLHLGKIITPDKDINWSELEQADVVIIPMENLGYGFEQFELLDKVLTSYPNKVVIAETDDYSPEMSAEAKRRGAHGYIHRDDQEEILGDAISKIVKGERFFMGIPSHLQG